MEAPELAPGECRHYYCLCMHRAELALMAEIPGQAVRLIEALALDKTTCRQPRGIPCQT